MDTGDENLLKKLQDIDEYEFEHLVADLWEKQGWNTTVTASSNDGGVDVIAEKDTPFYQKQLIQAKRYSSGTKVGSPDIQQYSSLRHQRDNVDTVVVVTTSDFTAQAQEAANNLNVKTVTGAQLVSLINDLGGDKILQGYLNISRNGVEGANLIENHPEVYDTITELSELVRADSKENHQAIVYLHGSKSGYSVMHSYDSEIYNVHSLFNDSNTVGSFDENDWATMRSIATNSGLQVFNRDAEYGGRIQIGRGTGTPPESREILHVMRKVVSGIFSATLDDIQLRINAF